MTAGHARMHLYDWPGAAESLQRAVDLDPSYTPARYVFAEYLVTQGRFDEAIAQARRAVALEPAAAIPNHALGTIYYYARRYSDAQAQFRAALELDPNHTWSHGRIGQALEQEGRFEDAAREFAAAGRALPLARAFQNCCGARRCSSPERTKEAGGHGSQHEVTKPTEFNEA